MAKVNVSLPDDLLEAVDGFAEELKRSRSGLVQEATARYVAELRAEKEKRERSERIGEAMKRVRETAARMPAGVGPSGAEIIRRERDRAPRWSDGEEA